MYGNTLYSFDASLSPFIPGDERYKQCWQNCESGCGNDGFGSVQSIPSWARNWILTMCAKRETIEHSIWAKPKNISTHCRFAQRGSEILLYFWKSQIKRTGNWTFSFREWEKKQSSMPLLRGLFWWPPPVVFRKSVASGQQQTWFA